MSDEGGGFVFAERVWFLLRRDPFTSDPYATILPGLAYDKTGKPHNIVYAFSDEDLARRWVEDRQLPVELDLFSPTNDEELIDFLEGLKQRGHRNLGTDSKPDNAIPVRIDYAIEQIRRRHSGN